MAMSFRGKHTKDIETAAETVISGTSLLNPLLRSGKSGNNLSITGQLLNEENFDTLIEKRIDRHE